MNFLRRLLDGILYRSPETVIRLVTGHYGVKLEDIEGRGRKNSVRAARIDLVHQLYSCTSLSEVEIALIVGRRVQYVRRTLNQNGEKK